MERVAHILEGCFGVSEWEIAPPAHGRGERAYLARGNGRRVFIKFGIDGVLLGRLSCLGVAPPVIATGMDASTSYVIQEYVNGRHPDRAWIAAHLPELALLVRRYQEDAELHRLLAQRTRQTHVNGPAWLIHRVRRAAESAGAAVFHEPATTATLEAWGEDGRGMGQSFLVPSHPDPNTKNLLVSGDHLYLLDWDDAVLSDPMHDVGPLLWWYAQPTAWSEFFAAYGEELTDDVVRRVYWWAAYRSIAVALWLDVHRPGSERAADFVADFVAASARMPNPHWSV